MIRKGKNIMATTVKADPSRIIDVPLSDIYVDHSWNTRSDKGDSSGGPDEHRSGLGGFNEKGEPEGFLASFLQGGTGEVVQDTPVFLRVRPENATYKQPYFLVAGFRRHWAISEIAAKQKNKKPTIRAIARVMTDGEARELNIRENAARQDLSEGDLAYGIIQLSEARPDATQETIAAITNATQGYVSKILGLKRIKGEYAMGKGKNVPILQHWRTAQGASRVTVDDMCRVSKLDTPEKQAERYAKLIEGKAEKVDGRKDKLLSAKQTAARVGTMLGNLARESAIEGIDDATDWSYEHLEHFVSVKKDKPLTDNQRTKVAEAFSEAYNKALAGPEVASEEGEKSTGGKGKGKGKGGNAAATAN